MLEAFQYTTMGVVIFGYFIAFIGVVIILNDGKLVDKVLNNEKSIKKDLFQDVEDRGIGYIGVLESLVKEIESYGNEKILKECSLPNKTWEETKEEYIRYYTDNTFETYWLWIAISDLSNKLAENLKNL